MLRFYQRYSRKPAFQPNLLSPLPSSHSKMASIMRSAVTSALVVAVVISSAGVALAHEGHAHAPAPGPAPASGADGLLPGSIVASFFVAVTGFLAARFM
ncbi:hypothetical protein AXG93_209s1010 [Marchantia polymorpha subsp. ruderalis]|uniref:Uncharacterized protein n=1 Tax=Marchantia polymorpha subsp. ruderalis TaxID=1480154 RepID=A0A176VHE8_MARPO|nr:hypothetical protein AXG93_209s1010 [Marchantia polymorpha subsp. ruderalis]